MAYWALSPKAAPGVDGVTWADYGQDLVANLRDLHDRVHSGRYRARPSRRAYIPKADGRLRPLGIAALEDKIVQRAVVEVLNAIYETDFLGFSYGFRPGRGPHDALDALAAGIWRKKVNWVLDADIRDFFASLIGTGCGSSSSTGSRTSGCCGWSISGWPQESSRTGHGPETPQGSPQGASVSPLLANIYLHYVLDLWADWWRRHVAHGDVIIVRYADDFVMGFEDYQDARRVPVRPARAVREVRAGTAPRQDAADRVRAVRRRGSQSGDRETGDVRLPRLHAHLRDDAGRAVLGAAHRRSRSDAGQAG